MPPKLKKYAIGLAVTMLFVVGLSVWLVAQAGVVKADNKAYDTATKIADKLNGYIDSEQVIPESLSDASIHNAPDSVTYTKISEEKYKFCVEYKTNSSGMDTASLTTSVMTGLYGDMSSGNYPDDDKYEPTSLYINYYHKKGQDCQTIKPYVYKSSNVLDDWLRQDNSTSLEDVAKECPYDYNAADQEQELNNYYSCIAKQEENRTNNRGSVQLQ